MTSLLKWAPLDTPPQALLLDSLSHSLTDSLTDHPSTNTQLQFIRYSAALLLLAGPWPTHTAQRYYDVPSRRQTRRRTISNHLIRRAQPLSGHHLLVSAIIPLPPSWGGGRLFRFSCCCWSGLHRYYFNRHPRTFRKHYWHWSAACPSHLSSSAAAARCHSIHPMQPTMCLMNEGDRNKIRINCCSGGVSEQTQMQPQTDRRTDRHNLKLGEQEEQEEMLMRTRWLVAPELVLYLVHCSAEMDAHSCWDCCCFLCCFCYCFWTGVEFMYERTDTKQRMNGTVFCATERDIIK